MGFTMLDRPCRKCGTTLEVGINIRASRVKNQDYVCRPCERVVYRHAMQTARSNWLKANGDKRKEVEARYYQANKDRLQSKFAKRRAKKAEQTPADADQTAINAVYQMANRLTRIVGASYHVDHANALSNGGLHHPDNLVVMRADWNLRKGANDWPWLAWFNAPASDNGGEQ